MQLLRIGGTADPAATPMPRHLYCNGKRAAPRVATPSASIGLSGWLDATGLRNRQRTGQR